MDLFNHIELDIAHHKVHLDIEMESLKATFTQGKVDCQIGSRFDCFVLIQLKQKTQRSFSSEEIFEQWCVLEEPIRLHLSE